MGFSKYFMDQSDGMWARGKDMIKYILKRGGKMGGNFQVSKMIFYTIQFNKFPSSQKLACPKFLNCIIYLIFNFSFDETNMFQGG